VEDSAIKEKLDSLLKEDLKNYERIHKASTELKLEVLLKEELKNFIRINGVKFDRESFSLLHLAAKNKRVSLCVYLIDKIIIGKLFLKQAYFFGGIFLNFFLI